MDKSYKQFKLLSGEEIICEVVEWPAEDDDDAELIVKNVYEIKCMYNPMSGYRIHSLRPWFTMQIQDDLYQSINAQYILSEANPVLNLVDHYKKSIEAENNIEPMNSEEINFELSSGEMDSMGDENIIYFPNKDKLH